VDGLTIAALVNDWNEQWIGARIDKIHQPNERDLVLSLRTRTGNARLLLSAHRTNARSHKLERGRPTNPEEPPMFCMLLRKRIEGGRIVHVQQQGWDRILSIRISALDDIGDTAHYDLILEIMGKLSNLILCQVDPNGKPGRIVDSIVHVTSDMSRYRQLLPGLQYLSPPPQNKRDFREIGLEEMSSVQVIEDNDKQSCRSLMNLVAGIGPLSAQEILYRSRMEGDTSGEGLLKTTQNLFASVLSKRELPSLGLDELGYPVAAAPYELRSYKAHQTAPSMDDALDELYFDQSLKTRQSHVTRRLEQAVSAHLDRLRGKSNKLARQKTDSQDYETLQRKGEILTAFSFQVNKGDDEVTLPDFYDDNRPIAIALDPALTPTQNAQHYFKQSSKKKRGLAILDAELSQVKEDFTYLENVLMYLQDATPGTLGELQAELERQGFVKTSHSKTGRQGKKAKASVSQADAFMSSDGFEISVGRNNTQNDRLTLRQSKPMDIWLHVKDVPGSHVVINGNGAEITEQALDEGALLAAYFSKARTSSNVAVDYTYIKHVWKVNGARPGHVLYDHQRTLFVTPDRTLLEDILTRQKQRKDG
jgi:predicted ribosome quality control (RQC) complex YloA/Tae2 family protein